MHKEQESERARERERDVCVYACVKIELSRFRRLVGVIDGETGSCTVRTCIYCKCCIAESAVNATLGHVERNATSIRKSHSLVPSLCSYFHILYVYFYYVCITGVHLYLRYAKTRRYSASHCIFLSLVAGGTVTIGIST